MSFKQDVAIIACIDTDFSTGLQQVFQCIDLKEVHSLVFGMLCEWPDLVTCYGWCSVVGSSFLLKLLQRENSNISHQDHFPTALEIVKLVGSKTDGANFGCTKCWQCSTESK